MRDFVPDVYRKPDRSDEPAERVRNILNCRTAPSPSLTIYSVIAGMEDTLHLTGTNRYTVIVLVFFPSYVLFQPIATVLARRLGPRSFLAGITLAFGLVVLGFGFVDDWKKMVGLRVLLGAFESCYFPSAYFLVSMWYVRREVAKRLAFFFLIGNTAGGFGGLLAHGLSQMAGVNGIEGWRWIVRSSLHAVSTGLC